MQTEPTHERQPFVVHVPRTVRLSSKQFWEFCQANRDWRCERSAEGDIVIMPPTGGATGAINARIIKQSIDWDAAPDARLSEPSCEVQCGRATTVRDDDL